MLKKKLLDFLERNNMDCAWLECLQLRQEHSTVYVGFPHMYYAEWFKVQQKKQFENILARYFDESYRQPAPTIIYETCDRVLRAAQASGAESPNRLWPKWTDAGEDRGYADALALGRQPGWQIAQPAAERQAELASEQAQDFFATFIVNGKNAFSLAAAKEVAASNAQAQHVPFLLCGRSGTGKSHLLKSIGATLLQGGFSVIQSQASTFFAQELFQEGQTFWQSCHALVLDDLQELTEHPRWQRRLADYIDACPGDGKHKMVLSLLGTAQNMRSLDERLRTRLESGLIVELQEPDLEVRMRFLQGLNTSLPMKLNREHMLFIAQNCSHFRLLQGLARKAALFCSLSGRRLSTADLEDIIASAVVEKSPGCMEILAHVAQSLNVTPEDILGRKRNPELVRARQLAMYICRQELGLSYPELGKAFGGKDHSTVIYAIKKIEKLAVSDKSVKNFLTSFAQR